MEDYLTVLQHEFAAEEGSFIIQLRVNAEWDKVAFTRLISAMKNCCEQTSDLDNLERWLAEWFWYITQYTQESINHQRLSQSELLDYYERADCRLAELTYWFFSGIYPYIDGTKVEPL